jgi:hypothetical protein
MVVVATVHLVRCVSGRNRAVVVSRTVDPGVQFLNQRVKWGARW